MSAVVVLTPIVIANWPAISAAVVAAAASAGFTVAKKPKTAKPVAATQTVELQLENMDVVAETLAQEDQIVVEREGVRVVFSRDARGHFKTCVSGDLAKQQLEAVGQDLAGRVVQQYVYQRLTAELQNQGFITMNDEKGPDQVIRLHVRRYE